MNSSVFMHSLVLWPLCRIAAVVVVIVAIMSGAGRLAAQEGTAAGRIDLQNDLDNVVRQAEEQRVNAIAVIRKLPEATDIPAAARQAGTYVQEFLEIHQDGATPEKAKGVFEKILRQRQATDTKEAQLQASLKSMSQESLRLALGAALQKVDASRQSLELTYRRATVMRQQIARFQVFTRELPAIYTQIADVDPVFAQAEIRKAVETELEDIEMELQRAGSSSPNSTGPLAITAAGGRPEQRPASVAQSHEKTRAIGPIAKAGSPDGDEPLTSRNTPAGAPAEFTGLADGIGELITQASGNGYGSSQRPAPTGASGTVDLIRRVDEAQGGAPEAQRALGIQYYNGDGVRSDHEEAARWLRKAAVQGDAVAQRYIGTLYYSGDGVERSHSEAARWFRKAAEQGDGQAQRALGSLYSTGEGVPRDVAEATQWLRKAAEQRDVEAQRYLGLLYYGGAGIGRDFAEAFKWLSKAVEQGDAEAQNGLGTLYYKGDGVRRDYAKAAKLFRAAAEKGAGSAQNNLGICLENGQGVRKDVDEAMKWFRKAAEQGDPNAIARLGVLR